MATAITRIYTPEGFVVASDGRVCNSSSGKVIKDDMQKVFLFGNAPIAFSFTGAAHLGRADRDDTNEVLFDFIAAFSSSVQAISARRYGALDEYIAKVAKRIHRALEDRIHRGNIELPDVHFDEPSENGCTIVDVYVDGYHEERPSKVAIRFFHEDQRLFEPEVRIEPLEPARFMFHGIGEIGRKVVSHDPSLAGYIEPVYYHDCPTLETAISLSRAFIEACAGPEGAEIDPDASSSIGGRTHIAVVSPARGFEWVPGFEPAQPR